MASVSTDRRQGITASAAVKVPCKVATTGNITLSGEQTIDGVACTSGDRVLVKSQTSAVENGIYYVNTGTWQRAPDWDGILDVKQGTFVYVTQGSTNTGFWYVTTSGTITPGTTSVTIERASSVLAAVTPYVQTLLDDANASEFLTTLGVSAYIQTLMNDSDASTALSTLGVSAFIKTLLDDATSNAALTTLTATRAESGAVAIPVLTKLREEISAKDFGSIGNGTTDDRAALALADAAGPFTLSAGTYRIASNLTLNNTVIILPGAMFSVDSAVTLTLAKPIVAGRYQTFAGSGSVSLVGLGFPEWFGAVANGTTNDAAAINKCIASSKGVDLNASSYYIGSTSISISTNPKSIIGKGRKLTNIIYTGLTTTAINVASVSSGGDSESAWNISGFTLVHDRLVTPTDGKGINIVWSANGRLSDVAINSSYHGIALNTTGYIKLESIWVMYHEGIGILLDTLTIDCALSDIWINGETAKGSSTIGPGQGLRIYGDGTEGHVIRNVKTTYCDYGLAIDSASFVARDCPSFLKFTNCYFDTSAHPSNINNCRDLTFDSCWFSTSNESGLYLQQCNDIGFEGCNFYTNKHHGVLIASTAAKARFVKCSARDNSVLSSGTYNGFTFSAGVTDFVVQSCVADNGAGISATQGWGIRVETGASDRYIIADNLVTSNINGGVSDDGSGANKRVANNY